MKNVKLVMYMLLQMGDWKKAKEMCEEYMIKCCRVCGKHFFSTLCYYPIFVTPL